MKTIILHIVNEDPILADMDDLPDPTATYFLCSNLRKRDGKPINYIEKGVKQVLFPWSRVSFVEIMTSSEELRDVYNPFREA